MEIDRACFVEGIAYGEDEMLYFLESPSAISVVAELVPEPVAKENQGGLIQGFRARTSKRLTGRIITIDVEASAQGTGVGKLLMDAAEAQLQQAGCDLVCLEVAVDNSRALRFYKKLGYQVLKTLPRYYLDSIDGLLMGKRLLSSPHSTK
jgi:ribosomal protein S18 acetylase RimI-like enzyme